MVLLSFSVAYAALIALIFSFCISPDWSTCLASISTIMSIMLGLMSIVYSYRCNKATDELLKEIDKRYKKVAQNAQTSMMEKNIGEENYNGVTKMIKER